MAAANIDAGMSPRDVRPATDKHARPQLNGTPVWN